MDVEQYTQDQPVLTSLFSEEALVSQEERKPLLNTIRESECAESGGFDCNICLDFVQDPVVTLCGHLYCWPCIYKWIHLQSVSGENDDLQQPLCPVCKASVSQESLVPIYGRGQVTNRSEAKHRHIGLVIPQRPSNLRCEAQNLVTTSMLPSSHPRHELQHVRHPQQIHAHHQYLGSYTGTPIFAGRNVFGPTTGMLGEMVYSRIFGNSETTLYAYPNSYALAGSSNPRVRRFFMAADKSLGRICFFLCCCTALCLLLF